MNDRRQDVKSMEPQIFHPSITEDVFSLLDEEEKVKYYRIFGNKGLGKSLDTCEEPEGRAMEKFVYFLADLKKETLTWWVDVMNPPFIVKICKEAEPDVLAEFVGCLGSSVLNVLYDNDTYNNMREDKLVMLLCVLQIYGYLHKIYEMEDVMLRVGNYLVNKSNKSKYCSVASFFKALLKRLSPTSKLPQICTDSSASSVSGILPYSWMKSEGKYLYQKVVCPIALMNSEGESCHNLQSRQQLHAAVNLKYEVVSRDMHAEMRISTDNVRCRVLSYQSCSRGFPGSYCLCRITIKVEPQPSDSFDDEIPELKLQKSTYDDPRKSSSGCELSGNVNFPIVSGQVGAKATKSTTKDEVQWTYRQYDVGSNIGGIEWTHNSSYSGGECVFGDDKYPEPLMWRINQDITKPKTLSWRIHTHFYLKSPWCIRNHIVSHEVIQSFNFTV